MVARTPLILFAAIAGCGDVAHPPAKTETSKPNAVYAEEIVRRTDFRDEWPFTVDEVRLQARGETWSPRITIEASGTVYGLNGLALMDGFPKTEPIRRRNENYPDLWISYQPLIDRGLKLVQ